MHAFFPANVIIQIWISCRVGGYPNGSLPLMYPVNFITRVPPKLVDHPNQKNPAADKHGEQERRGGHPAVKKVPDRKKRRPNDGAAGAPAQQGEWNVLMSRRRFRLGDASLLADTPPSWTERANFSVEGHQHPAVGLRAEEGR